MIPVSTVPSAISTIEAATKALILAEDADPNSIWVGAGDPGQIDVNDIVIVGSEVRRDVATSSLVGSGGQHWLEETYELDVTVSSWLSIDDPGAAVQRAYVLMSYAETAVRQDPSLGGAVQVARPFKSEQPTVQVSKGGWLAEVVMTVSCYSQI